MFFAKLDISNILSSSARESKKYEMYMSALRNGEYKIYMRYNSDVDDIDYVAVRKKEFSGRDLLSDAMSVRVDLFGKIEYKEIYQRDRYFPFDEACLLAYINEKESSMGEEEIKNAYGESYSRIKMISGMTPTQRRQMSDARISFSNFIDGIKVDDNEEKEDKYYYLSEKHGGPLDVIVSFDFYTSNLNNQTEFPFSVSLKGRFGTIDIPANKMDDFEKACEKEIPFDYRKCKYLINYNEFTPIGKKILHSIFLFSEVKESNYYYSYKPLLIIKKEKVGAFFDNIKGATVFFDYGDAKVLVEKDERNGSVGLNIDGNLSIDPYPNRSLKMIGSNKNNRILFDTDKDTISTYKFESSNIARLYDYFYEHGPSAFEYLKDIFVKKALPVMGSGIIKYSYDQQEAEGKLPKFLINLYIDLDDNDHLVTKTIYKYDNNEVEQEDIPQNPLYDACLGAYLKTLKEMNLKSNGTEKELAVVYSFLRTDLSQIKKVAKIFLSDRLAKMKIKPSANISISISQGSGWLTASMDSQDYTKEELMLMLSAYRKKKKFFVMHDNVIVLDEQIGKAAEIMDEFGMDENLTAKRIPYFEAFKFKDMDDKVISFNLSDKLIDSIKEVIDYKNHKIELDESIDSKLRDYQRDGIKWMDALFKNHLDGILADDMGLGKTLEAIAFISLIKSQKPVLIVCPTSVVYNWAKEFKLWNPSQKCVTIEGDREFRQEKIGQIRIDEKIVYVTSYDSLRNDLELYKPKEFSLMIIDEAQYIKNATAMRSKSVKSIKCDGRFALTGTPIENRLADLWSIFDYLMHGYLGSYDSFRQYFEIPITINGNKERQDELLTRISPFILRRTKQAVLDSLPPKTTSIISVNMNEMERKLYVAYLQNARNVLREDGKNKIGFLAALTKLRQICVDAGAFFDGFKEKSSKFSVCKSMIDEAVSGGHQVLVFSFFASCLPTLKKDLKKEYGIDSQIIDGSTKSEDRVKMATSFNNGNGPEVMLVSLKAGGTGLNLIGADIVIHIDPWWNFAAEEQATDRAYRIGQTKPVSVYKLVCHDSIEERVIELQEKKKDLYDAVIKSGDEAMSRLTEEDLKFIIS